MVDNAKTRMRCYLPTLVVGENLLPKDQAHHVYQVMRLKAGELLELFDGTGRVAVGVIKSISKRQVVVSVESICDVLPPAIRIHLAFAVPKGKRLDWLLEKTTELAAASLRPVVCERSVAGGTALSDNKIQRWQGHCISAMKQCGLNFLPEIRPMQPLAAFLEELQGPAMVGDLCDDTQIVAQAMAERSEAVTVLVGPEGGFTEQEREAIRAAGVIPVCLGPTILRIETAAVALLAAIWACVEK